MLLEKIPIILLNLKRRKEKLEKTKKELDKLPNKVLVWEAVDGNNLPEQQVLIQSGILHQNFRENEWVAQRRGSIGNYLSFIEIYSHIQNSNCELTLIVEDDIILTENFNKKLEKVLDTVQSLDWDLLYLGLSNVSRCYTKDWKIIKERDEFKLLQPLTHNGDLYGNFGLLVKKKVATEWLRDCLPITQASDSRLGSLVCGRRFSVDNIKIISLFQPKLKGFVVEPPLITYTSAISDTNLI